MGKTRRWARNSLLSLLVVPAALDAQVLRVRGAPPIPPTAFYLVPERQISGVINNPEALRQKLMRSRWRQPMSATPLLPPGQYYIFAVCGSQIMQPKFISHQERVVTLQCR